MGEIDLVARRRRLLLFVEVKFRDHTDDGLWAICPQQQRRIAKAAEVWLATQPALTNLDMRFDATTLMQRRVDPYTCLSTGDLKP